MSRAENQVGFYYIEVRPTAEYKTFRAVADNAGENGGIERVIGQRADGVWETVKWLVGKSAAHVEDATLVADASNAKELFCRFAAEPKRIEGNRFEAKDCAVRGIEIK